MTNSWIIISKGVIVIGSTSLLLMGPKLPRDKERSSPVLILVVALSSLLLVSSVN